MKRQRLKRLHSRFPILRRASLHWVLVVPFTVQVVVATGLVGYLSFRNGQQEVEDVADQLLEETGDRVYQHLEAYLGETQRINQNNLTLLETGLLNSQNFEQLGRYFWQQVQISGFSYVNYGNQAGEFIGAGYFGETAEIAELIQSDPTRLRSYVPNAQGDRLRLREVYPDHQPNQAAWYTDAIAAGKPIWSEIYRWADLPGAIAISASAPVYNANRQLVGVVGIDVRLDHLSHFLEQLNTSPNSTTFILDRSGHLVASSTQEPAYSLEQKEAVRLNALDSNNPIIQATARYFSQEFEDLHDLKGEYAERISLETQQVFLHTTPYRDAYGLDWLIVTVIPESDFMAEINLHNRITILLCVGAAIATTGLGMLTARWITRPLLNLNAAAKKMAKGDFDTPITLQRGDELGELADSFNHMASQLQTSLLSLHQAKTSLEAKVVERTAELQANEARYRAIVEDQTELISRFLPDTTMLFVNEAYCRYFGINREEIIGKSYNPVVYEADREQVAQLVQSISIANPTVIIENRVVVNGDIRWTQWVNRMLFDNQGNFTEIQSVGRDITALKQTEQALRESEERFREIAQTIDPIFLVRSATTGQFIYVSPAYEKIWGRSCENLYQDPQSWLEAIYPADRPLVIQSLIEQFAGHSVQREYRIIRSDGEIRWVYTQINLIKDEDGNPLRFVGFATDISDRKQAELALQRTTQQLQAFLDNAPAAISLFDAEGRYLRVNAAVAELLDMPESSIVGKTFADFFPESAVKTFQARLQRLVEMQQPLEVEDQVVVGEETRTFRSILFPIAGLQERPTIFSAIATDISDRKQLEQEVKTQRDFRELLFNESNDAIFLVDVATVRTLDCNRRAVELFEVVSKDELIDIEGHTLQKRQFTPDELEAIRQELDQQGAWSLEVEYITRQGREFWGDLSAKRIVFGGQQFDLVRVVDIDQRKRAEAALRQSEAENRAILAAIPDLMFRVNTDGILLAYVRSNQFINVVDEHLDPIGSHLRDLLPVEIAQRQLGALKRALATQSLQVYEQQVEIRGRFQDEEVRVIPLDSQNALFIIRDISEQQAALRDRDRYEEALRDREQQLRLITDALPGCIAYVDATQHYRFVNKTYETWFGYKKSELMGQSVRAVVGDAGYRKVRPYIERALAGESLTYEAEVPYQTGGTRFISATLVPDFDDHSTVRGYYALIVDISDRKRAELALQQLNEELEQRVQRRTQALSQSEERLRLALVAANQGLYDLNVQTGEIIVSPEYATMLGYDPATFQETYATWAERLHPDDRERVTATHRAYIANETSEYKAEYRLRTQAGHWKWMLSVGRIVGWDEAGKPLRMLGTHTNISDRKQAEQDLQESRNMLKLVLDTIPQRVFWKDRQSKFLGCNPAFAGDYQLNHQEIVGKTDSELPWAAWADIYQADDAKVMDTCVPKLNYEEPTTNFNGETIWIRTSKIPLTNSQGEVIGILGCYDDITARKQAESALQQLNLELEQRVSDRTLDLQQAMEVAEAANQAKSLFLANMSHELRTPLNVILGFAQVMAHDDSLTPEQQENLQIIHRSGDHLLSLINDILDISKIEAGRMTLDESSFNLPALLQSLQAMFRQKAEAKDLKLNLDLAPDLPSFITADLNKLRQVLINLLSNAIKFTEAGSVTLRVSVAHPQTDQPKRDRVDPALIPSSFDSISLRIAIEDTGIGIQPYDLTTIFEAFVQTQAEKYAQEGTGLGLAISRRFVDLMGGTLTATSTPHQGSTFNVEIPVRLAQSSDVQPIPIQRRVIGLAPGQPAYRLLVVDDQAENCRLLMNLLVPVGFEVQQAQNGESAIHIWQQWHPHLIWMDIRMPGMNGDETTRQIRASENGQSVVIIALTAQASRGDREQALAAGCNDFMSKPFRETTLFAKLEEHLGLKYVYADTKFSSADDQQFEQQFTPEPLTAASLSVMPPAWITQLYQAALYCDDEDVLNLVKQIPETHPSLIVGLKRLACEYQFNAIMKIIQSDSTFAPPPSAGGS